MLGLNAGLATVNTKVNYHISVWDTTKTSAGSSNSDQIKLPTYNGGSYDFTVYWDDGTSNNITTWNDAALTKTYSVAGIKTIIIVGQFEGFRFNDSGDKLKLLSIDNAGKDFNVGNLGGIFYGCANLTKVIGLDTSNLTYFWAMFANCSSLIEELKLDTSNATDTSFMMQNCILYNKPVNFDTSKVNNMWSMFYGCALFNKPVNFNTANVQNMRYMFGNCTVFNQSLASFNTAKVTNMQGFLYNCKEFNQSLSHFDTSKVTTMDRMLFGCSVFNQPLANFNTELVTDMQYMLYTALLFNHDISGLKINSCTTMAHMLEYTALSNTNYSDALIAWEAGTHQNNVPLDASAKYETGAVTARTALINDDGWTINDGGAEFSGILDILDNKENCVYDFVPYKRITNTYVGNKLYIERLSDNTKDYIHTSDFDSNGDINSSEITTWANGGDVVLLNNYSELQGVNGITYQSNNTKAPKIVVSGVWQSNGPKFDGVNDIMSIDDYSSIQFTTHPITLYTNYYPIITGFGYAICKNLNNFETIQFATRFHDNLIDTYLEGNTTAYNEVDFTNNAQNNYICSWKGTGSNEIVGKTAIDEGFGTANITLTNRPNFTIGARSEGIYFYEGHIKSILIFKSDEYSNYTNFVNAGI
jgi:surface protein